MRRWLLNLPDVLELPDLEELVANIDDPATWEARPTSAHDDVMARFRALDASKGTGENNGCRLPGPYCGLRSSYFVGSVTVLLCRVTAVCASRRPLIDAPVFIAIMVLLRMVPSKWAVVPRVTAPAVCQNTFLA
ncbi:hypothetical protein SAMN05216281_11015 [Cryobacterium luteum]|nr:hypothetical protein SAMN05216281_11015 [Cryobacterium luteum]